MYANHVYASSCILIQRYQIGSFEYIDETLSPSATQSNYLQLPVKCQYGAVSTQSMDLKSCKLRA